ncbi:alpha/beta hydrolase [Ascidiaceihabitans sp.]|nr:alpha/beta hydrolase [Ascidiaceihabitans sp.]
MFIKREFTSEGSILRGRWYAAQDAENAPCIVMCHGTSATVPMALSSYATEFQNKGFNVFLYDHAGFGRSDGKTRQTINPWVQGRGLADAVEFVKSQKSSHNGKIVLWGDSFAGMIVLVVAGLVDNLAGVVSYTASCGINVLNFEDPKKSFSALKKIFYEGGFDQLKDLVREGPMPVVSSDQESTPSLLLPIQAFRWFIDQGGQWNSGWENKVTRVIPKTEVPFSPLVTAPFIKAPVLMMTGKEDEMPQIVREVQVEVFNRVQSEKQYYEIDGGHFGAIYPHTPLFYEAIAVQSAFIKSIT